MKEDILYLYRNFIVGHVSLKFSGFIRKSILIRNVTEANDYKNW